MTRRALLVLGGTGRFSSRLVPPLVDRVLAEGCSVVLASSVPVPDTLVRDSLTVVSLRPTRWMPSGAPLVSGREPRPPLGRVGAAIDRRVRARYPEYAVGRETWQWVRASTAARSAAADADLIVAVNPDAVRAVWELGRRHAGAQVVNGASGAEAVIDAWHRAG
ncbi:MAG TPA: hypothetical protein VFL59_06410 [Candidatus Nanopelagicales bacterium]|nr:hypothetical protein [Candidatus Nanopelagicales bacterium]